MSSPRRVAVFLGLLASTAALGGIASALILPFTGNPGELAESASKIIAAVAVIVAFAFTDRVARRLTKESPGSPTPVSEAASAAAVSEAASKRAQRGKRFLLAAGAAMVAAVPLFLSNTPSLHEWGGRIATIALFAFLIGLGHFAVR